MAILFQVKAKGYYTIFDEKMGSGHDIWTNKMKSINNNEKTPFMNWPEITAAKCNCAKRITDSVRFCLGKWNIHRSNKFRYDVIILLLLTKLEISEAIHFIILIIERCGMLWKNTIVLLSLIRNVTNTIISLSDT